MIDRKETTGIAQALIFALGTAFAAELVLRPPVGPPDYLAASGRIAAVFLVLFTIHRFGVASLREYRPHLKDLACLIAVILGSLFIVSLGRLVALSLSSYLEAAQGVRIDPVSLYLAIPFATGALLLQAVLGMHYGLIFGLSLAIIVGVYLPQPQILIPYVFTTVLTACLSLSRFRARSAYLKAGLHVSLVAIPFALASVMLSGGGVVAGDVALRLLSALLGGVLCTFVAAGVIPLVESLGGYVTDMRLIEMATFDHPLLKELSIQAPGTWNHSMVMGMMVESAADSVGANPVLARVGAYFHDIGKMKKPLYFVENQSQGENRHDKLSPSMSALIIRAHVKDGMEMAKQHKLPRAIEDMISQHHGTSLIEYFYDKAVKEAEAAAADGAAKPVDESLYTYPGPKPQSREAGILMLADGIEAAARTLSEPTLDRIQGMVQKMMNKVFASGELNECDLTLQDLHQIAKCFTRVLNGIYHQRIAYAEPAEKINERTVSKAEEQQRETPPEAPARRDVDGGPASKKLKVSPEERTGKEDGKEDLKRLGL